MNHSKIKEILVKFSSAALKTTLVLALLLTTIVAILFFSDYNITVPRFITSNLESKLNHSLSTNTTKIKDIILTKKDYNITIKTEGIEALNTEKSTVVKTSPIYLQINTEKILEKIDMGLEVNKIFIDTNLLEISLDDHSSKSKAPKIDINNTLEVGYFRFKKANFETISLKKTDDTHDFSLKYQMANLVHSLKITKHNQELAKFDLEASSKNKISYIDGNINHFPIWSIITFLPKELHTSINRDISENFLINGNAKYRFENETPNFKLSLVQLNQPNFPIKDFVLQISNHKQEKTLFVDKIEFKTQDGGTFSSKGKISTKAKLISDKTSIHFDIQVDEFDTKYMSYFWPQGVGKETRSWLIKGFQKGRIKQAKVKINFKDINKIKNDNFYAYLAFEDLGLDYFSEHHPLTNLSGTANFDLEKVSISIDKGKLRSADIGKSLVEIEYGIAHAPITIKTSANGQISDFTELIGKNIKDKLLKYGVDTNQSNGKMQCSVFLDFPLDQSFSLKRSKINAKAKITSFDSVIYNKINISDGNLNVLVNNDQMYVKGPLKINGQNSNFDFTSNMDETNKAFKNKLVINSHIESNSNFEDIFNNKLRILKGSALLNLEYLQTDKKETVSTNFDFDNSDLYIPALGITKKKGINSNFNFKIENLDDTKWKSTNLSLTSGNNIKVTGNLSANDDFSSLNNLYLKVIYPNTDLDVNYKRKDNHQTISVQGNSLNLENAHISELFSNNNFTAPKTEEKKYSKPSKVDIKIDIKKAKMNNGIYFYNISGDFQCSGLECDKSNLSVDIDKKSKLSITRKLENKNKPLWILKSNNAAKLLNGLGLYKDITGGNLTIKMWNANQNNLLMGNQPVFVGSVNLENFKVIKNPIITKLVSFTSIMGILNIFTDMDKIPFKSASSHFVYANDVLRINRTSFTGPYLTLSMNGTINWNYNDIDLYGKVVPPVYGFNAILAFIPFLGHKTADGKGKGIIAADYSITGKIGHSSVFINPLAIFFPEFIYLFA